MTRPFLALLAGIAFGASAAQVVRNGPPPLVADGGAVLTLRAAALAAQMDADEAREARDRAEVETRTALAEAERWEREAMAEGAARSRAEWEAATLRERLAAAERREVGARLSTAALRCP